MPQLDPFQQVFALSMLSNRASSFTGAASALQQQLQYELGSYLSNTNLNTVSNGGFIPDTDPVPTVMPTIPPYMGNWRLEWGPVVYSHSNKENKPSGVADNAMFVASCPGVVFPGCVNSGTNPVGSLTTYVVAIAATNPSSDYDWSVEDFAVDKAVLWKNWTPGTLKTTDPVDPLSPAISLGTAIGVTQLLQLTPPTTAPGAGQTLSEFLGAQNLGANSAVVFTGHSLAGALAPTTALYLKNAGTLNGFGYSLVYATAGATPGNVPFTDQFNAAFPCPPQDPETKAQWLYTPTAPHQCWNTLLWNSLDVIPHAWQLTIPALPADNPKLAEIPGLYGTPALSDIETFTAAAMANSGKSGAIYTHTRNLSLAGTIQPGIMANKEFFPIPYPPAKLDQFLAQLYVQHIGMYSGIPASLPNIPQCNGLILEQPVPPPTTQLPTLPGVATDKQDIHSLIQRLESFVKHWLAKHHLP